MDKVVITAALCGAGTFKWNNENVPYVPEEFAAEARKCYEAGASIVHIHGRDPETGFPTPDLEITKRIIDAVRDAAPELIINMSTAIAPGLEPEARITPVRENLPAIANWPTFPQLWVGGELIGGCDIVTEMHENGELQPLVKLAAAASEAE